MVAGEGFYKVVRDPWDAPPAGIADDFSAPTCPLKLRSAHYLTTNTLGHCAFMFSPVLDAGGTWNYANVATAVASDTISAWASTDHPDAAALIAAYSLYRPVSVGIKAYYVGPVTSTSGILTVAPAQGISSPATQLPTSITELADLPGAVNQSAASMTDALCFVGHMYDRVMFNALTTGLHANAFPSCIVALTGGLASTAVLRVEVTLNCEFIPLLTNIISSQSASVQGASNVIMDQTRRLGSHRIGDVKKVLSPSTTVAAPYKKKKSRWASNTTRSYGNAHLTAQYVKSRVNYRRKRANPFAAPRSSITRYTPTPRFT